MEKGSAYLNPLTIDEYLDYRRVVIIEALKDAGATPQVLEAVLTSLFPQENLECFCELGSHIMTGIWIATISKIEPNKGMGSPRTIRSWIFIPTDFVSRVSLSCARIHWPSSSSGDWFSDVIGSSLVNGKWVDENKNEKTYHNRWAYCMKEKP